ncbi:unnamed protein product [Mytilus edulis]|uniref:Uncharacterized protein n=1 Tax=Mytilus edulis TaxID=6550 RepID=A0A8S3UEZ6_MYTED|nr:unnamed protein product [Mytilus edulis]
MLLVRYGIERNPGPHRSTDLRNIKIVHNNVCSLPPHVDLIECELGTYDIIALSESHLDDSISNESIALAGFQKPIRLDRTRAGGGVIIYVKNYLYYEKLPELAKPVNKAELLNSHFSNISKIDVEPELPNNVPDPPFKMEEIIITEEEVLDQLKNLNCNKPSGPDGVSPRILKEIKSGKSKASNVVTEIEEKKVNLNEMKDQLLTVTTHSSKLHTFLEMHQIEQQVHQCQRYVEDLEADDRTKAFEIKLKHNSDIDKTISKLESLKTLGEIFVDKTEMAVKAETSVGRRAQVESREQSNINNMTMKKRDKYKDQHEEY